MTKWILVLIICSYETNTCMPSFEYPVKFDDSYDCMTSGYKESLLKTEEIGRDLINKKRIYIKFGCKPIETV